MSEKWVVIINPKSGSAGDDFRGEVENALKERQLDFEVRETTPERGGEVLAGEALAQGDTHILACGGDGTIMAVVNGIGKAREEAGKGERTVDGPKATLGIVPGGTANLLATALGIPRNDVAAAVGVVSDGRDRTIDLGCCGDVLFALGVGLGLTERLISRTSSREKETIGKWAYVRAMLSELGAKPSQFVLKLDGVERKEYGVAVVVANAGDIGGKLQFAPDAEMDDGKLDVCLLRRFYFRDVVRMIWRSLTGRLAEDRAVDFFQGKHIEIISDPPLDLQIDGEEVEQQTPLVTDVLPGALRVRVPREEQD